MKKILFCCISLLFLSHCGSGGSGDTTLDIGKDADPVKISSLPFSMRSFLMGTAGYIPAGYPSSSIEQWQDFYDQGAALYGGLFGVHANAYDTKVSDTSLILSQTRSAETDVKHVIPYFLLSASHSAQAPFTDELGAELVDIARANAKKYKPIYFGLGNENNIYYYNESASYNLYVQYLIEALDAVKQVSPNTITFTNFQLDMLRGKADLTGTSYSANWSLLDAFKDHVDAFAFTVYPFFQHKTVADIPTDYLSEIRSYTDLPIIITETGWPTVNNAAGVTGSNQEQIDYMTKIAGQANDNGVIAIMWVLPHDGNFGNGGIFDNISLFANDGTAKPAYEYWKAIAATTYIPTP